MSAEADIVAVENGNGGATVHGVTDAGRAHVLKNFFGNAADWIDGTPLKIHIGCTGLSPFLKAAEAAGLVVVLR